MLFLFGIRSTTVATVPLPDLACAYCHTPDSLLCVVVSRYLHVFWIPILPVGKSGATVCKHCKQVLTSGQMPASYRGPVQALEQQARTPLAHFWFLALFGLMTVYGIVAGMFAQAAPAGPDSPAATTEAIGNRYRINLNPDGRQYDLAEVVQVTPDSVYFRTTTVLRGPLTTASATIALRDSVAATAQRQGATAQAWSTCTSPKGLFKRIE